MLTLLVYASLLLHVLTFIAIRTLQSKVTYQESQHQEEKRAYEAMLGTILEELREENERLLNGKQSPKVPETPTVKEKNSQPDAIAETGEDKELESEYSPPQPAEAEDDLSMSNLGRVLQLADLGLSAAAIAKQLGMGKTEVELILLMKKNGEKNRNS
ncbi:hypothetical protein SAMN05421663_103167 [Terribacillus halophilus]|uniref:Coupling factor for flagellin transcription and translation n=1 Tax=Terribacillus halophilus TaxID=361279 RepID=A0A1G6N3E5_9BACI|nr:hypothetical protein [Terribacillus halophilus]SDC62359.1 hypothetical protein SAMN05421663_103167 [Terribacillus halophilus]